MTRETREMVQESWTLVLDRAPAAAQAFYDRLFDIDPQLGRLFRGADMGEQGRALMRVITTVVRGLGGEAGGAAGPAGTTDPWESAHQMIVGGALFTMLERSLGERFVSPLRAAWMEVFSMHGAEIRRAALGGEGTSRVVPLQRRRLREIAH
ncbi:MAG TPA: hypothetical protein VF771_01535 [Longimicrobiaceae bacterium]